jgi:hypothetical protein
MRFSARLDTSYHGPLRPLKNAGIVVDSFFIVSRSCIHEGIWVSSQVKIQRIQVRRAWRPCSGSSSTYLSVMIGVIENISRSTAEMCRSTIMHVQYSFSCKSQSKCFRMHVDVGFFSCFGIWKSAQSCPHLSVMFCICHLL